MLGLAFQRARLRYLVQFSRNGFNTKVNFVQAIVSKPLYLLCQDNVRSLFPDKQFSLLRERTKWEGAWLFFIAPGCKKRDINHEPSKGKREPVSEILLAQHFIQFLRFFYSPGKRYIRYAYLHPLHRRRINPTGLFFFFLIFLI